MTETATSFRITWWRAAVVPRAARRRARASWPACGRRLSIALILMVISEMFASSSGLGYRIVYFQRNYLIAEMWSGIVLLGLIGVLLAVDLRVRRAARPALVPRNQGGRTCLSGAPCCGWSTCARSTSRPTGDVEAIGDISFTMDAGELVCIVGPSGCGKTTLLKCIAGLLRPTGGVVEMRRRAGHRTRRRHGLVFQEYGRSLYPWLTVRGNVELPLEHKKLSRAERDTAGRRRARRGGPGARRHELPLAALRRHAAAGGDRPRHRLPARGADHGRAVRRGRRADPGRPGGPGP